jgi:cell division protein FtsL
MAAAASAIKSPNAYNFGTAAPAYEPVFAKAFRPAYEPDVEPTYEPGVNPAPAYEPGAAPVRAPKTRKRAQTRQERLRAQRRAPSVSLFSMVGSVATAVLMIFVILAQISYNEVTTETVRLNNRLRELNEEERRLRITFESVVDMKAVEQYARDVLGMSKPEADQISVVKSSPKDRAEIVESNEEGQLKGIGRFLSSLLDYFRR